MQVFWFDKDNVPENAELYDTRRVLRVDAHRAMKGPIVLANPSGDYNLRAFAPSKKWIELYTEHHFSEINSESWCNDMISKPVGIISGFGLNIGLKMSVASSVSADNLPKGARGAAILFVNGPNLNLLGVRQPEIYGKESLGDIFNAMRVRHPELKIEAVQSNSEGAIVDCIHSARDKFDAIIINAGAYTHTSIAVHDALKTFDDIIIELHLSNPHQREAFRHISYVAPASQGLVAGFGARGYELALMGAMSKL